MMPMRYFENPFADFSHGQDIEIGNNIVIMIIMMMMIMIIMIKIIDYRLWKSRIKEIIENILRKEAAYPQQKGDYEIDNDDDDDLKLSDVCCFD